MKYTLGKLKEDGTEVSVRQSETSLGGSPHEEYETTSKTRVSLDAKWVNRRMPDEFIGVRIYEEDD